MQPPPIGRALFRRSPKEPSTLPAMIRSAARASILYISQQSLGGLFDESQDVLETVWSTVIRVGNLTFGRGCCVVQEGPHDGVPPAEGRHRLVVLLVHGQDVVEAVAVFGVEKSGPLARDIYAASQHA